MTAEDPATQHKARILRPMSRAMSLLGLLGLLLGSNGCGNSSSRPEATVQGKVTLAGQPLTRGQVVFSSSATGTSAAGVLQTDGTFELTGAIVPGAYRVYILPPDPGNIEPGLTNPPPVDELKDVPQKYKSETSTDLTAEVKEGENSFEFDLQP